MKVKIEKRISKLPRWAQEEIEELNRTISNLKRDLDFTKGEVKQIEGKKETNTFLVRGIDPKIPLPNDSRVEFSFGNGWKDKIQCKIRDDVLEIFADNMLIMPYASNHIQLKIGK